MSQKDDLISRAEAIDAVQHAFDRETLLNSFVRKVAVDALKTMPSAQQWRTGEPTEDGDYLCYLFDDFDKDRWFEVCSYYDTDGTAMGDFAGWRCGGIVLAWMPLPEPPEVKHE